MQPGLGVGKPDLDLVVEAAGTPEGGIERARSISGGYDADSAQVTQPVHEGEELGDEGSLEALAHHVARGGEGVYLVEEDDRRRFGARLVEDRTQLRLALAPELVEDLRFSRRWARKAPLTLWPSASLKPSDPAMVETTSAGSLKGAKSTKATPSGK